MGLFTSFQLRSRDAATRRRAALNLGTPGKTSAVDPLVALLEDGDWTVREAAAQSLGRIGLASAAPALLAAIKQADRVSGQAGGAAVRAACVRALGLLGGDAVPAILAALPDRHARLREGAIEALGAIGGADAVAALTASLCDERSSVRRAAAAALVRTSGAGALSALEPVLIHKDPTTRRSVVESLGSLKDGASLPALQRALGDRDRSVREAAVGSLSAIASSGAVDALIGGLRSGDRELKATVSAALRSFEWTPRTDLQDAVHGWLHGHLEDLHGDASFEVLVMALSDRDPSARRAAAEALGRRADPRAAGAVAALLRDPDAPVRESAAEALALMGPSVADVLAESLEDHAPTVRSAAERVLAGLGEGPVVVALVERLSPGQASAHGRRTLRVVDTRGQLDAARRAADVLGVLLARAVKALPADALRSVAALADIVLIEPGQVPDSSETVDTGALREAAASALARRGL